MTTENDRQSENGWKALADHSVKFILVLVMAWAGWQQAQISKIDERVYILQRDAVTEQKMNAMEQRIIQYTDVRLSDISSKMDIQNKYLEMVFQNTKK
jgi:hypothetical protein